MKRVTKITKLGGTAESVNYFVLSRKAFYLGGNSFFRSVAKNNTIQIEKQRCTKLKGEIPWKHQKKRKTMEKH